MRQQLFRNRLSSLVGGLLIFMGGALAVWAVLNLPANDSSSPVQDVSPVAYSPLDASPSAAPDDAALSDDTVDDTVGSDPEAAQTAANGASPSRSTLARATLDEAVNGSSNLASQAVSDQAVSDELILGLEPTLPAALLQAAETLGATQAHVQLAPADAPTATATLQWDAHEGVPFYRQVFAAATRFDIVRFDAMADLLTPISQPESLGEAAQTDEENTTENAAEATLPWPLRLSVDWREIQATWAAPGERFPALVALAETRPALESVLGAPGAHVAFVDTTEDLIAASWSPTPTLALAPFEHLHPRLTVLAIDGQNPAENAERFEQQDYPLTAVAYIRGQTDGGRLTRAQADLLQMLPNTNRNVDLLTVVAATGVTAMSRMTAAEMESRGYDWPAEVVGPELSAADITLINNEVPFIEGCEPNIEPNNLVFCSKPEYMETLLASGVTVVGLTGNHQNDFGWQGMRDSLAVYDAFGIPVYGGGANREEAIAPLYVEHNGNRLAFLGVNSFGPPSAWATETEPGSAPYDLAILSATIRSIKEEDLADVVLAEFQYQEIYEVEPLWDQRNEFRAVVRAGADIVTGVQSHVPQAIEFQNPAWPEEPGYSDDRLILYGLGNLYFDQMFREDTRDNLIAKHTVYDGRHLSTQLLTTVLYDYGQPRWAEADRHRAILERVFGASGLE